MIQIQSTLDLLSSWLTPTSLFVLVNLVIGTIAIATHLNTPKKKPNEQQQLLDNNSMPRSLLIDRVKSINLSLFKFDSPETHYKEPTHPELAPQLTRSPSLMQRLSSFNLSSFYNTSGTTSTALEQPGGHVHKRCMSESDAKKVVVSDKLKNSASFGHFEENEHVVEERRRPATMRVEKTVYDEKINEKADDFINKFKQQLRLQRLDSILKYKNMLGRGSAK